MSSYVDENLKFHRHKFVQQMITDYRVIFHIYIVAF